MNYFIVLFFVAALSTSAFSKNQEAHNELYQGLRLIEEPCLSEMQTLYFDSISSAKNPST